MKSYLKGILIIPFVLVFALLGCDQVYDYLDDVQEGGQGNVLIAFNVTTIEDYNPTNVVVIMTPRGKGDIITSLVNPVDPDTGEVLIDIVDIEAGKYDILVQIFDDADPPELIAEGEAENVNVKDGEITPVDILVTLKLPTAPSTGVQITVHWELP